jgi:hypothetical protein
MSGSGSDPGKAFSDTPANRFDEGVTVGALYCRHAKIAGATQRANARSDLTGL